MNRHRIPRFRRGGDLKAEELNLISNGVSASPIGRSYRNQLTQGPQGQTAKPWEDKSDKATQRAYVEITGSTSPSEYTGNLLTSYFDDTVIGDPINIIAKDVTTNTIANGEKFYADLETDAQGDTFYIITVAVTL